MYYVDALPIAKLSLCKPKILYETLLMVYVQSIVEATNKV